MRGRLSACRSSIYPNKSSDPEENYQPTNPWMLPPTTSLNTLVPALDNPPLLLYGRLIDDAIGIWDGPPGSCRAFLGAHPTFYHHTHCQPPKKLFSVQTVFLFFRKIPTKMLLYETYFILFYMKKQNSIHDFLQFGGHQVARLAKTGPPPNYLLPLYLTPTDEG